jgi:hypothetical protein
MSGVLVLGIKDLAHFPYFSLPRPSCLDRLWIGLRAASGNPEHMRLPGGDESGLGLRRGRAGPTCSRAWPPRSATIARCSSNARKAARRWVRLASKCLGSRRRPPWHSHPKPCETAWKTYSGHVLITPLRSAVSQRPVESPTSGDRKSSPGTAQRPSLNTPFVNRG